MVAVIDMWFGFAPYILAVLAAAAFISVWQNPQLSLGAGWGLVILALGLLWRLWEPRRLARTLWPWWLLLFFWLSALFFFLFLEQGLSRAGLVAVVVAVTWWYLLGWLGSAGQSLDLNQGPGLTAAVVMVWIILFFTSVAAVSWLVFLDTSWWLLLLIYFLITAVMLLALGWIAGWSMVTEWPYLATALLVQLEAFIVLSWWPTNLYLIGWLQASIFLALFLFTRYDTSVAMPRRILIRNLLWLAILSVILIASSRWF